METLDICAASGSSPLVGAATRTLVLFYMLSPGRCDLYALSMEPLFTHITTYPELIMGVIVATCTT